MFVWCVCVCGGGGGVGEGGFQFSCPQMHIIVNISVTPNVSHPIMGVFFMSQVRLGGDMSINLRSSRWGEGYASHATRQPCMRYTGPPGRGALQVAPPGLHGNQRWVCEALEEEAIIPLL